MFACRWGEDQRTDGSSLSPSGSSAWSGGRLRVLPLRARLAALQLHALRVPIITGAISRRLLLGRARF